MGAAAVPLLVGLTVASTAYSVKQSIDAGKIANAEAKIAANREGDAARQREIERRRALLRSLGSQAAGAGARGIDPNATLANADIQYATDDLFTDRSNTAQTQAMLRLQGQNAKRAGKVGAVTSLLDGATGVYGLGDGTLWNKPRKP